MPFVVYGTCILRNTQASDFPCVRKEETENTLSLPKLILWSNKRSLGTDLSELV